LRVSTPLVEAYRAAEELRTAGIASGLAVANQVLPADAGTTPFSRARGAMQRRYLAEIGERFPVPVLQIPLLPYEIKGLDLLARLGEMLYGEAAPHHVTARVGAAQSGGPA
jgi:arsenite-transporting ATPase